MTRGGCARRHEREARLGFRPVAHAIAVAVLGLGCAAATSAPHGEGGAPDPERAALDAADLSLARGELAAARAGYAAVAERSPGDARAWSGLARIEWAEGDLVAAIAADDRVRGEAHDETTAPANPRALKGRERCSLWLAAALQRIEAEAPASPDAAAPDHTDPAALLARIDGEPACAHVDATRLRGEVAWRRAAVARAGGDLDAAVAAATDAVRADASRVDVEREVGRWLLDAGRRRDALVWLEAALGRHPGDTALQALMLEALGVPGLAG